MAPAKKKKKKLSDEALIYKKAYDEEFEKLHREKQVRVIEEPEGRESREFTKVVIRKAECVFRKMEEEEESL